MTTRPLPPVAELSRAQHDGHACVWCRKPLRSEAISAGIARGQLGAHVLDVEVYACPTCHQSPAAGNPPIRPRDGGGHP